MISEFSYRIKNKLVRAFGFDWTRPFHSIGREVFNVEKSAGNKKLRIMIGPSFAIWAPSFAMDKSLSLAFHLHGCEVIPIYCDGIQSVECNYYGGDWGGKKSFQANCKSCQKASKNLWKDSPHDPLKFSGYITAKDASEIDDLVFNLSLLETLSYSSNGIEYGALAKDILVNNRQVATLSLVDDYEHLLRVNLKNLLLVSAAYERILDEQKPDRVVSNDSYFGMWAILQRHCLARSIPFYSHWPTTSDRSAFAFNDAAMNLDLSKSWLEFSKMDLVAQDENQITDWLEGRRGLIIDTTKLAGHEVDDPTVATIRLDRPTIILPANVSWDLAALNKQIIFRDMNEWILETIKWFIANQEFQLIIRPHPIEASPQIPPTQETVLSVIESSGLKLSANIFLLRSDINLTFKDLIRNYEVKGIVVHTTTVGFECAASGVHVVTTAKSPYRGFGFTIDPIGKQEYFSELRDLLLDLKPEVSGEKILLAKKFINFYQFHYYANLKLFSGNPPKLASDYIDILASRTGAFRYVVDKILQGEPINDEKEWIPRS